MGHLHLACAQILSSGSVESGTGVYWMFYSGGSFEEVEAPEQLLQASCCRRPAAAAQGPAEWPAFGSLYRWAS
jgi:hypothetical protein